MPRIWSDKPEIHAAFITREIEPKGLHFTSVTNLPDESAEYKALESNRRIVAEYLSHPNIGLCMGKQIHGKRVAYVRKAGLSEATDGLVTDQPGLAVGVLVADCAAVLFADPVNKIVGAVHSGWRGAVSGILQEAVRQMEKIGAEPDLMQVYISPCISQSSFEVGEEVASQFSERHVDRSRKKPHVDLRGFILQELIKAGISNEVIIRDEKCTMTHPETLHSHRRDGAKSGRMMGIIYLSD